MAQKYTSLFFSIQEALTSVEAKANERLLKRTIKREGVNSELLLLLDCYIVRMQALSRQSKRSAPKSWILAETHILAPQAHTGPLHKSALSTHFLNE